MKLIVGLGNPGREYKNTRHNIGFMVLDEYLGKVTWKSKMESYVYQTSINGEDVIFAKPLTYMNLSGLAVSKLVKFYKINVDDILVIQDDMDLALGAYRIKKNSSSGGHNGIKSIINELNTENFARLKIGIDKNKLIPSDKYVLGKLSKEELDIIKEKFPMYKEIIEKFISNKKLEDIMSEFN